MSLIQDHSYSTILNYNQSNGKFPQKWQITSYFCNKRNRKKPKRNHSIEQDLKSSYAFLVNKFLNSNHFNRSVTIYIVSITFTIACTLESFKLLQHKWYSNSRAIHTHIYMHINHEYSTFSITMTINWRLCLLDRMVVLAVPMRSALFILVYFTSWRLSHVYHKASSVVVWLFPSITHFFSFFY